MCVTRNDFAMKQQHSTTTVGIEPKPCELNINSLPLRRYSNIYFENEPLVDNYHVMTLFSFNEQSTSISRDFRAHWLKATTMPASVGSTKTGRGSLSYCLFNTCCSSESFRSCRSDSLRPKSTKHDNQKSTSSPHMKQVFFSTSSFCCFSERRSANVSMITPNMRLSTMMMRMKKKSRS